MSTFTITRNEINIETLSVAWSTSAIPGASLYTYTVKPSAAASGTVTAGEFTVDVNLFVVGEEYVGTIPDLLPGTEYDIVVYARNVSSLLGTSQTLTAYTAFVLHVAAFAATSISVAWDPLSGLTGDADVAERYTYEYTSNQSGATGSGTWTLSDLTTVGGNTISRNLIVGNISGLVSGDFYDVHVTAVNTSTVPDSVLTFSQKTSTDVFPTSSFTIATTTVTSTTFGLTWSPVADASQYAYVFTTAGIVGTNNPELLIVGVLDASAVPIAANGDLILTIPGLVPSTEYLGFIAALYSAEYSVVSQTLTVSTLPAVLVSKLDGFSECAIANSQYVFRRRLLRLRSKSGRQ